VLGIIFYNVVGRTIVDVMNFIDIFLIVVILFCMYAGWLRGFILSGLDILVFILNIFLAFLCYPYLSAFLTKHSSLDFWSAPLSFIVTLILFRVVLSIIVNQILKVVPASAHASTVNHVLGVIPGAVNGFIWATVISALLLSIPFSGTLSNNVKESVFTNKITDKVEWLNEKFSPVFDEAVSKTVNKLSVNQGSESSIQLPFKTDNPRVREDLESKMLILVNEERQKAGLKPLKPDLELRVVARDHSKDMFARGYFSHITPEGKSPFDRMRKAKVRFLVAGENLALGQTLYICHTGLMNSPGHRANILNTAFSRVGIGILDGGIYGLMVTQNFRN